MMHLLRRRTDLVCQQVVELVTEYLENTLSRSDRRRFESHLLGCPNCTHYLAQRRATIQTTGTLRPDDLSPEARRELIHLFHRWQEGGGPAPA
jgi:anti-sigma factor RsiW